MTKIISRYPFLIIIFLLIFFFYLIKLGSANFAQDSHSWYHRTQNFVEAIEDREWGKTFQHPKPGVTVMLFTGLGLESFLRLYEYIYDFRPNIYTSETFKYVHFATMLPLVLSVVAFLLFYFFSLKKLLDEKIAYLALILLAFEPFFIGISRLFYADGVMTVTMAASVLLLFLFKTDRKYRFLYLSAILGGLALLTKMQAVYIILYAGLFFILETLFDYSNLKKNLLDFAVWFSIFLATVILVFPALWVDPITVFNTIWYEIVTLTLEGENNLSPFNFYFFSLPGRTTYFTLFLFIIGVGKLVLNIKKENKIYLYSVLFIVFYVLQMSLVAQKIDRYMLPVFPFVAIISAYGLYGLFSFLKKKVKWFSFNYLLVLLLAVCLFFPLYYLPYFTAFYNKLWGHYWGFHYMIGYEQVGEYLNSQKESHNFKIVVHTYPQSLRPFVRGSVYSRKEEIPNGWQADYYIIDNGWTPIERYSQCDKLVKEVNFRRLELWDIYFCK